MHQLSPLHILFNAVDLDIGVLKPAYAELMHQYEMQNKAHLAKWEPRRTDDYYTIESCKKRLEGELEHYFNNHALPLVAYDPDKQQIIAKVVFSQIARGPFQACYLGYNIHHQYEGKGLMFSILQQAVRYVFETIQLHRIMANYIPENQRSGKLLARLGFEKEGLAKSYLKINGRWQDHILTAKLNANFD